MKKLMIFFVDWCRKKIINDVTSYCDSIKKLHAEYGIDNDVTMLFERDIKTYKSASVPINIQREMSDLFMNENCNHKLS